jgi:TolB-like protein/DNA-binding winged helix-turn-helix (wHTH) protein/Tfp pilus assembly protein PilF
MDFRLGPWLVQPGMSSITGEGHTRHITSKSMEVLVCLAKRQGHVAMKEEIFREVWPETFVSDDALTRCIGELRRALHDDAREPSIIRTVPKRGYLIAVPVVWEQGGEPELKAAEPTPVPGGTELATPAVRTESVRRPWLRRSWPAVAGGVIVALAILLGSNAGWLLNEWRAHRPPIQAIAVLPFTELSGDPEQEYFADGMTDQLITELAQLNSWKVISRTSMMRYKRTDEPIPQIAGRLGVDGVIEGSVLRSGGRVRITVQLIHAATDRHLWSGSFEREANDVLQLQNRVARAIAAELNIALRPRESARLKRTPKVVPEAYEAYLKGQHFFNRDQFQKAASHFQEATRIDPGFAVAHAFLYEADAMASFRQDQPVSARALAAMKTALALDDSLAEAHTDAGAVKFYWDWDWKAGEAEFRRAIELDPGSVDAVSHYALCLHVLRRWDAAMQEYGRTLQLDPVSPRMNQLMLKFLVDARRYDLAVEQFRKTIELDADGVAAYSAAGSAYEAMGKDAEAAAAYLKADNLSGKSPERLNALEAATRAGGVRGYWRQRLEQLQVDARRVRVPPLDLATHYVRAGDREQAIWLLEQAYHQRAPRLVWINASAVWEPLRSDGRFQSLLRRMGFPE